MRQRPLLHFWHPILLFPHSENSGVDLVCVLANDCSHLFSHQVGVLWCQVPFWVAFLLDLRLHSLRLVFPFLFSLTVPLLMMLILKKQNGEDHLVLQMEFHFVFKSGDTGTIHLLLQKPTPRKRTACSLFSFCGGVDIMLETCQTGRHHPFLHCKSLQCWVFVLQETCVLFFTTFHSVCRINKNIV